MVRNRLSSVEWSGSLIVTERTSRNTDAKVFYHAAQCGEECPSVKALQGFGGRVESYEPIKRHFMRV